MGLTLRILLFYLAANLFHVEVLHLLQQVFQGRGRQSSSFTEDKDAIAEDHQRRNGLNLQRGCQALIALFPNVHEKSLSYTPMGYKMSPETNSKKGSL